MSYIKLIWAAAIAVAAPASLYVTEAQASDTVVICSGPLEPVTVGACATAGLLFHELFVTKKPFGPNGEVMRVVTAPVKIMHGNFRAAERESGEFAKVLRATSGISLRDIDRYGLLGGPGSELRKLLGIRP